MRVIKPVLIFAGLVCLLGACIFPIDPGIGVAGNSLVINGRVTDREGLQYVEISRSSPVNSETTAIPLSGYMVEIHDDLGNSFVGEEVETGKYACMITREFLIPGTRFRLRVTSPEGKQYESDYDELLPCPPIQEISYEIREELTADPNVSHYGVQFLVSTAESGEGYAQNFLWDMEETWEYHSRFLIQDYYDGEIHMTDDPSDSIFYCWDTRRIPDIYVYSTRNLSGDEIRNFPLHYISDQTDKLRVKYSLLLKQYSLSEKAYQYWTILEEQSKQAGALYETQPSVIEGNIYSIDDPDESELGLFYATAIEEKRAFFRPRIPILRPNCDPWLFDYIGLLSFLETFHESEYPVYLVRMSPATVDYTYQSCFDCRLRGGTLEVPDFWHDEFDIDEFD